MKQVLVLFADWELNSDLISGLSFRSEFWQGLVPGALEGQVTPLRASLSLGLPFFLTPCPRPWFTLEIEDRIGVWRGKTAGPGSLQRFFLVCFIAVVPLTRWQWTSGQLEEGSRVDRVCIRLSWASCTVTYYALKSNNKKSQYNIIKFKTVSV